MRCFLRMFSGLTNYFHHLYQCGGGEGGGRSGEKGAGGVWEAGEDGAGSGIPNVAVSGRKREE